MFKNIVHKDRHLKWFFVYFGYSKDKQTAYVYVKWSDSEDSLTYDKVNHFYAAQFFTHVGRDSFFQGLSGKLGYVNFNLGKGAFKTGNDFNEAKDSFGFSVGVEKLVKKQDVGFKPADPEKTGFENAQSQEKPVVDKTSKSEQPFEEYGYGFWLRFLTVYPERLLAGKNQAWYFVSRLTLHQDYDNIRMGDRVLAIWQG